MLTILDGPFTIATTIDTGAQINPHIIANTIILITVKIIHITYNKIPKELNIKLQTDLFFTSILSIIIIVFIK